MSFSMGFILMEEKMRIIPYEDETREEFMQRVELIRAGLWEEPMEE